MVARVALPPRRGHDSNLGNNPGEKQNHFTHPDAGVRLTGSNLPRWERLGTSPRDTRPVSGGFLRLFQCNRARVERADGPDEIEV